MSEKLQADMREKLAEAVKAGPEAALAETRVRRVVERGPGGEIVATVEQRIPRAD